MSPEIERLLILQDRDKRIYELSGRLERIPADRKRAQSMLEAKETVLAHAKKALQEQLSRMNTLEFDIETRRTTIQRLKEQQFETRKNDVYAAIGHDIERYKEEVDKMETKLLEQMESQDQVKTAVREAEGELAKAKAEVEEECATLDQSEADLDAQLAELDAERKQLATGVEENLFFLYDRLTQKKGPPCVVSTAEGRCQGCHVKLVASTLLKAQTDPPPVQCDHCGRILYAE